MARGLEPLGTSLLVDLPNHGRSGWTDDVSYPAMAEAVAALIADHLGHASLTIVGHSMGGKVAMTLALLHPELAKGLVVIDIAPDESSGGSGFDGIVTAMQRIDLAALKHRKDADRALRRDVTSPSVRQFLLQNLRTDHRGKGFRWQVNLDTLGRTLPDIMGWPAELDGRYDGPVLWVRGDESDYVQPQHFPAMMRLFPHTALLTVEHAGHWVNADQPQAVIEGLHNFLLAEHLVEPPVPPVRLDAS